LALAKDEQSMNQSTFNKLLASKLRLLELPFVMVESPAIDELLFFCADESNQARTDRR
jgi:hypothetical protein